MAKSGFKADAKRKHVEELQESEDRLRILADDAPVLIWVMGPDGSEFVNLAYLEFVGVSREVDVLDYDWTQFVHPDDRDRYLKEYLDCFKRQVPFNAVLRFRRHDGEYRWMKSIGKPRYTSSGEFYGYVGSTQDITDVKLLEDELRKTRANLESEVEQRTRELRDSEEKYRRIVETASEGIWILDRDGVTSFVNPAIPRMLGYAEQEIVGKPPFDFIDDTYKENVRGHLRSRIEGAEEQYVCKYRRNDGGEVWAIITANPIYNNGEYAGAFAMITDITERTHAENALKKREADLSLSQKIAHVGSWRWDEATGRNEWSDEFYRILGYGPGEVKPGGDLYMSMVHPDDREAVARDAVNALAENRPSSLDYRLIRKDGALRHVHVEIPRLTKDKKGDPTGHFGTIQDITERKRAEEALQESEEKFRALAKTSPAAIFVYQDDHFAYVNPSAEQITGYNIEELQEMKFWDIIHPDDREMGRERRAARLRGEKTVPPRYEVKYRTKDGRDRILEINATTMYYKGRLAGLATALDVTERKRTEEAIHFERSQLLSIFDSIDEVIYVADPYTHEILYANRAMQEKFGKNLIGGICYREIQNRDAPCEFCTNAIILRNKGKPYRWEFHNHSVSRDFDIVDRIIKWPDGRDVRFEFAMDITERKRADEELKNAKAQAELYLDLMGHDISNMHQIALGYLEIAEGMTPQDDGRKDFIEKPIAVLQRSANLIRNVRKLQKLSEGSFQFKDMDACEVLVGVQREFGAVPNKTVSLNLNGCQDCHVRANELLHDVFANLVSNAIKHTGGRADINIDLDIADFEGSRHYRVIVEDNGPGISDDFKSVIFIRELKGTDKEKGMGLGLYLVKSLVGSYGGRVWVEDRVTGDYSKGARFVVMLPAVDQ